MKICIRSDVDYNPAFWRLNSGSRHQFEHYLCNFCPTKLFIVHLPALSLFFHFVSACLSVRLFISMVDSLSDGIHISYSLSFDFVVPFSAGPILLLTRLLGGTPKHRPIFPIKCSSEENHIVANRYCESKDFDQGG